MYRKVVINLFHYQLSLIDLYWFFLLSMPNDFYEMTSMFVLKQPDNIRFYRMQETYLSILYLPFIIQSIYYIIKKKDKNAIRPLLFLMIIALKDIVYYFFFYKGEINILYFATFFQFLIAFLLVIQIFGNYDYPDGIEHFLKLFFYASILSMIISFITNKGNAIFNNSFTNRFNIAGMGGGETAVVISFATLYFTLIKDKPHNKIIIFIIGEMLIMLTGCRKDVIYVAFICLICWIRKKKKISFWTKKSTIILTLVGILLLITITMPGIGRGIIQKVSLERYIEMFSNIFSGNLINFLKKDDSAIGRMDSIVAGMKVIRESPVIGHFFSIHFLQEIMQKYNYPTFPHSTIVWLYAVMGVFSLVIFYSYCKSLINLIKINSPFQYIFMYILIRESISGGANTSIKYIIIMLFFLVLSKEICKEYGNQNKSEY